MNPSEVAPSFIEVVDRIRAVLQGSATREEVSDWANLWVMAAEPNVEDALTWGLLVFAGGIDLKLSATEYLHTDADIQAQLTCLVKQPLPFQQAS